MRICSLLPSATEILFALGLGDAVVAVSHECDYPSEARSKPVAIRTSVDQARQTSGQIDAAVRQALAGRTRLYELDAGLLKRVRPDVVVTQELCPVCAMGAADVREALAALDPPPQVISLHPHTLEDVFQEIRILGHATNRSREAGQLVSAGAARLQRVRSLVDGAARPGVFCLEWLDPLMATGHWVPEMVGLAGGRELLGRAGQPSAVVTAEAISAAAPEVLVLMPCGFPISRTREELPVLAAQPWWQGLPAVRTGRVHLVDGPAYFNRSGPRLVDGVELLAGLLHPDRCGELVPLGAAEL